jgi:demethylmenaquinone methyltransferase/2-methoxy-6-polyprenyl-1,4-benzoquinol methylase
MLAEALGPRSHVTGVDVATEFLEHGRMLIERDGLSEQISLQHGSADRLPFEDDTFDWAWSADCVGYGPWDPKPMLREIQRVLRPGGKVAILGWSSEKLLPGFPQLEAKLQATTAGLAPFRRDMAPERHFPRFLGMLRDLGLIDLHVKTCVGTAHAPLGEDHRSALESLFEMRWPNVESELASDDFSELQRLIRKDSKDFILNHPDYYAFFTYSVFWGRIPP